MASFIMCIVIYGMVSADRYCYDAFECSNEQITTKKQDYFWADGYKSASGASTTISCIGPGCYCTGAFTCNHVSSLSFETSLECDGTYSCLNTNLQDEDAHIYCKGSNSCSYSATTATSSTDLRFLFADGFASCENAQIAGVESIQGQAAYALYNATIDSQGIFGTNLNIELRGYQSGLFLDIICQSGHVCNIYCPAHRCNSSSIKCTGDCIYNPYDSYIESILGAQITTNINALFDSLQHIELQHDEQCNNGSIAVSFDGSSTPFNDTQNAQIINERSYICCRSSSICSRSTIDNTKSRQHFIFSGDWSFSWGILQADASLFCSGAYSCYNAKISHTQNIYCLGALSCWQAIINQTQSDVVCLGYNSCAKSTIITNGEGNIIHFYFLARISGSDAKITCSENDECMVVCAGLNACNNMRLICDGTCVVGCDETFTMCPLGYNMSQITDTNPTTTAPKKTSAEPSTNPSVQPQPSTIPSSQPSTNPSAQPSAAPSAQPSANSSPQPSANPSEKKPSAQPNTNQSAQSSANPSSQPSANPFAQPTQYPTETKSSTTGITINYEISIAIKECDNENDDIVCDVSSDDMIALADVIKSATESLEAVTVVQIRSVVMHPVNDEVVILLSMTESSPHVLEKDVISVCIEREIEEQNMDKFGDVKVEEEDNDLHDIESKDVDHENTVSDDVLIGIIGGSVVFLLVCVPLCIWCGYRCISKHENEETMTQMTAMQADSERTIEQDTNTAAANGVMDEDDGSKDDGAEELNDDPPADNKITTRTPAAAPRTRVDNEGGDSEGSQDAEELYEKHENVTTEGTNGTTEGEHATKRDTDDNVTTGGANEIKGDYEI